VWPQFCAINCNVIRNNDVFEKKVVGKVVIGKSDTNAPINDKKANVPTIARPILKHRSSDLDQMMGMPSMPYRDNSMAIAHQNFLAMNRKPMVPNIYQVPFDGPLNDASKDLFSVQQTPNDLNGIIENPLKKYDLKKYFLKKILGNI